MPSIVVMPLAKSDHAAFTDKLVEPIVNTKGKQPERTGAGSGLSWGEVQEVVATNDLSRFHRYPAVLADYHRHLARVNATYGSVQEYVLEELLGWSLADQAGPSSADTVCHRPVDVIRWEQCPHEAESSDAPQEEYFDGEDGQYKVLVTPFPYAIPDDAQHLIVWCKQPILHPCTMHGQASSDARRLAWRHIQHRGLSGLIPPRDAFANTYTGELHPDVADALRSDAELEQEVRGAIFAAARPIREFVARHFGQRNEVVWFSNPPSLQSIPDLAHWHCMIRQIACSEAIAP